MSPDDPRHGTYAGGRVHRRDNEDVCEPCRRAEARYEQARQLDLLAGRPRQIPPHGITLRVRALVALGHSFASIGEALDMSASGAWSLAHKPKAYGWATTHAKVSALYEAWSMRLPASDTMQQRKAAAYARTVATKHAWLPPLALDDDRLDDPTYRPTKYLTKTERDELANEPARYDHAKVERRLGGDRSVGKLTNAEAAEVYRRLVARGLTGREIEETWGLKAERYTSQDGDAA